MVWISRKRGKQNSLKKHKSEKNAFVLFKDLFAFFDYLQLSYFTGNYSSIPGQDGRDSKDNFTYSGEKGAAG